MTWADVRVLWEQRESLAQEESAEDAMEGPDEYTHASSSLENITPEDTDWPWAHNQYRAYHP